MEPGSPGFSAGEPEQAGRRTAAKARISSAEENEILCPYFPAGIILLVSCDLAGRT